MLKRPLSTRPSSKSEILVAPLAYAKFIIAVENFLRVFARPLMLAGSFVALAWLGVFSGLYLWAHLIALVVFTLLFFDALGRARAQKKPLSPEQAKRRVEEASGLEHRPLDVLEDRPAVLDEEKNILWQAHLNRTRVSLENLSWPHWKLSFADSDPYALRYALLILLVVGLVFSWGALGSRLLASMDPALGSRLALNVTLDGWITPPDYTGLPPLMIATPAGLRHDGDVLEVPEGSRINAHLAERGGDVPILTANDKDMPFTTDSHGDFEASQILSSGETVSLHRGWQKLGSWHIRVIPDQPPQVAFTDAPSVTERKIIRLAYEATDDYGVVSIAARIAPRESLVGASNEPIEIPLTTGNSKDLKRVNFEDLTGHPWAGLPVRITLVAMDASGHRAESFPSDFTLPERSFFNPVAKALIEERKKLLQAPQDDNLRNEAANIMANIAHDPSNYRGDPLVLMALRTGAVRLVLDHTSETVVSVNELLWKAAVRIEDGSIGTAEQTLREAQKQLAEALDNNASERDIQQKIDQLHRALAQYLSELSVHMAARPGPVEDLSPLLGTETNSLTPSDLNRMLDQMRGLSASGAHEEARKELSKLQQLLENLRTASPSLSEAQKQALQQLAALRSLTRQQQELLDKTFQTGQAGEKGVLHKLASEQNGLLNQLHALSKKMNEGTLGQSGQAMEGARDNLQEGATPSALGHQNEAMKVLQQVMQKMTEDLRSSMMMLPRPGGGERGANTDPFGRGTQDDGSVKIPDKMETRHVREILDELQRRSGDRNRPKAERDYIDRLLQNF